MGRPSNQAPDFHGGIQRGQAHPLSLTHWDQSGNDCFELIRRKGSEAEPLPDVPQHCATDRTTVPIPSPLSGVSDSQSRGRAQNHFLTADYDSVSPQHPCTYRGNFCNCGPRGPCRTTLKMQPGASGHGVGNATISGCGYPMAVFYSSFDRSRREERCRAHK